MNQAEQLYRVNYTRYNTTLYIKIDILTEEEYQNYYPGHVCRELANIHKERIAFEVLDLDNKRIDNGNYIPESVYNDLVARKLA